jgi:Uma2 family endonuclease
MARARPHAWWVVDFLAFEAEEPERYEFGDGIVRMMTGGSAAHSPIKGNIFAELKVALCSGPCRIYIDDLKVVTSSAIMYPEVLVIYRPLAADDDRVPDPVVVVGVLSPTTERHDRIAKWREYQRIPSLRHSILVEQVERRVEVYSRTETGWALASIDPPEDTVALTTIGASLSLQAIYGAAAADVRAGLIADRGLPTRRASDGCGAGGASPGASQAPDKATEARSCASTTTPMPIST